MTEILLDQKKSREVKILSSSIIPKYSKKTDSNIINWNNDNLSIVSLLEWDGIYDKIGKCIVQVTIFTNRHKSEIFNKSLCLKFSDEAVVIVDPYVIDLQGNGIEHLHQSIAVFNPKWLTS